MSVEVRFVRRADPGHLLEEAARSLIQAHRSFPASSLVDRRRKVSDRVIDAWRRSVAAGAMRNQRKAARDLLRGGNGHILHFAVFLHYVSAFVQRVFTANVVPVLCDHEVNAELRRTLFSSLGQQDYIAV